MVKQELFFATKVDFIWTKDCKTNWKSVQLLSLLYIRTKF